MEFRIPDQDPSAGIVVFVRRTVIQVISADNFVAGLSWVIWVAANVRPTSVAYHALPVLPYFSSSFVTTRIVETVTLLSVTFEMRRFPIYFMSTMNLAQLSG